jgi:hypothetical protein
VLGDEVFSPIDVGQVLMIGVLDPQGILEEGCRILKEEKRQFFANAVASV